MEEIYVELTFILSSGSDVSEYTLTNFHKSVKGNGVSRLQRNNYSLVCIQGSFRKRYIRSSSIHQSGRF
ncbi:hypothetical protein OUZ56_030528 [Daphnia magna]|uniref:Uncharacterized protein n=1 Tax=Daphnia magna TaxID=35525 RepID=A0ABQ9ZRK3_9CRUS|nr:hypothetical protein OUZ56_030528 [Daphnia magna]